MTPRDRYRKIADRCRSIPGKRGLREHTVTLVISEWSGGSIGEGDETTTEIEILCNGQPPKVKFPTQREIALGMMSEGYCEIGPVTPEFDGGGFSRSLLNGADFERNKGLHLRVVGPQHPDGALYRIRNFDVDQALHFKLLCAPAEGGG